MKSLRLILLIAVVLCGSVAHAAVGDVVADCQSIANAARFDLQPGAGVEWIIHNLFWVQPVTLERFDGTDNAPFASFSGPGWQNISPGYHVNNTNRVRVLNDHGSAQIICFDAVVTKQ